MFRNQMDLFGMIRDMLAAMPRIKLDEPHRGPGRKTLYTYHHQIGRNRYDRPHQGESEMARRVRQIEAGTLTISNGLQS